MKNSSNLALICFNRTAVYLYEMVSENYVFEAVSFTVLAFLTFFNIRIR